MATSGATNPTQATQEVSQDFSKEWVAIKKIWGGQVINYVTQSSVRDTFRNDLDITVIDQQFDAESRKAVIRPANVKPLRVFIDQGPPRGVESSFISDGVDIPDGWRKTKSRRRRPSISTRYRRLAYVTINSMKIAAWIDIKGAKKTDAETFQPEFGFDWADEDDLNDVIFQAEFPTISRVRATNGLLYPISPTKIGDAVDQNLKIFSGLSSKAQALEYMGFTQSLTS